MDFFNWELDVVQSYMSHENLEQIKIWNDPNFHEDSRNKLERYNFSRNKLERYKSSQMCK